MENSISRLYELLFSLEQHFGKKFIEKDIDVVSKKEFLTYEMFKDKEKKGEKLSIIVYNEEKGIDLDTKDFRIIEEIEKNSWINYAELSLKTRINPKTIVYRIKRLEKSGIIKGYSLFIDWRKLGRVHYRVLMDCYVSDKEEFESLIQKIRENPEVISIKTVISKYVLEFDIVPKTYNELTEFISGLKSTFQDTLKSTDLLYVEEEI
jgi:DNA-binding Lrp family transcriptional regulator